MSIDNTKIKELQDALVECEAIAKQIVADKHHGKSQFAAPIRGSLTHAMELVAEHKLWCEKNPEPAADKTVAE
jgi:hypothetical protein